MKNPASLISALLFSLVAACGGSSGPDPQEPTPVDPATTNTDQSACVPPAEGTPLQPDQCTCNGGEVRPDIGDGSVACAAGETDLGRVTIGIEGGLCCVPATTP